MPPHGTAASRLQFRQARRTPAPRPRAPPSPPRRRRDSHAATAALPGSEAPARTGRGPAQRDEPAAPAVGEDGREPPRPPLASRPPPAPLRGRRATLRPGQLAPAQPIASRRPAGQALARIETGPTITDAPDIPRPVRDGRLRILGTTDLHGTIWPHAYATGRPTVPRGLAALAPMIRAARAEAPASILVDSGDMLQGTALSDLAMETEGAGPHPVIAAMTAVGYDAAALGNHDFNFGLDRLAAAIGDAGFPVLCANLVQALGPGPLDDTPFAPPRVILERSVTGRDRRAHPLRIGLVGATPPQTLGWDGDILDGRLAGRDIVAAVAAHAAALRAEGADLVVVLCHSGLGRRDAAPGAEDASLAVAALPEVDAVLCGHSHQRHPDRPGGPVPGTARPLVMAGAHGSDLAVIDLDLIGEDDGAGGTRWRIAAFRSELRPVALADPAPDPAILGLTRAAHASALAAMDRVAGQSRDPIHAAFPLAAHAPALQFLAEAQAAAARRLVAGTDLEDLPLLSAAAPFAAGGSGGPEAFVNIPPGPILERHLWQVSPFPNRLCVLAVTGRTLRDWLERAASCLARIRPGDVDTPLQAQGAAGYMFDVVFGLTYTIDPAQPARTDPVTGNPCRDPGPGRITRLCHAGRPVADSDRFALATSSYRAAGGGGYGMIPADAPRHRGGSTLRALLAEHAAAGPVCLDPRPAWDFAPVGATAILDSAPFACAVAHGDPTRRLEAIGPAPGGFARFRLHL